MFSEDHPGLQACETLQRTYTEIEHTVATDDDLIVADLEGAVELSSPELSEIATRLKNHPVQRVDTAVTLVRA